MSRWQYKLVIYQLSTMFHMIKKTLYFCNIPSFLSPSRPFQILSRVLADISLTPDRLWKMSFSKMKIDVVYKVAFLNQTPAPWPNLAKQRRKKKKKKKRKSCHKAEPLVLLGIPVLKQNLQQECPFPLRNEPLARSLALGAPGQHLPPCKEGQRRAVCPPRSPGLVSMAFSTFPDQPGQRE